MSVVCPQGHRSESEDYCDVCGTPIVSSNPAPVTPTVPETGPETPTSCPHCGSPAAPKALFCENCGYDFTTDTAPQPLELPDPVPAADPIAGRDPSTGADTGTDPRTDPGTDPDPGSAGPAEAGTALPTPPTPGPQTWVVEVWVDPDWRNAQEPEDPMPSPDSPRVIPLRDSSVLVGRPSASRNIHPQVDAGADTGVSRRHCQLSTDGVRWWVEDLDSANGTFVSPTGEPLPTTPLDVGVRHELAEDERIFIGGWTRLVVRQALPGEV